MENLELNQLNVNGFSFEITRMPFIKYSCQNVSFPSVQLPGVEQPTPFQVINLPGDHLSFDEINITFAIDEQLNNYRAFYYWMQGLAFPDHFEQFTDFVKGIGNDLMDTFSNSERINQFSDAELTLLTNHKNPNIIYRFKDAYPVSLSGFDVSVTNSTSEIVVATVTLRFTGMEIIIA